MIALLENLSQGGLRQGNPMIFFLFLIVAERLVRMVRYTIEKNLYKE